MQVSCKFQEVSEIVLSKIQQVSWSFREVSQKKKKKIEQNSNKFQICLQKHSFQTETSNFKPLDVSRRFQIAAFKREDSDKFRGKM